MDEIKYEYQFQDIGFGKISSHLYQRFFPSSAIWKIAGWVAVFLIALAFFRFIDGKLHQPDLLFTGLVVMFVIACFLRMGMKHKKYIHVIEHAPWRQGTTKITLSEKGIYTVQKSGSDTVDWAFVTEVVTDFPDNVLFLMSPAEFVPCPDASLPSNITRDDLLEQVAKWRAAA